MLLTLLGVFLLLLDVEPDNGKADHDEADCANQDNDVERGSWGDEQLETPVGLVIGVHEDDELRVWNDWGPHMLSALSIDSCCGEEVLDIVIRAANSEEGKWKLETHVTGLVSLRANHYQFLIL